MRRCWIVIALLAGCNGAPSCDDVAADLAHLARRSLRERLVEPIAKVCERDAWSAEARRCLKWVERRSRIHTCRTAPSSVYAGGPAPRLSEKQVDELEKQLDPDAFDAMDLRGSLPDPPPPPPPADQRVSLDVDRDGTVSFGGRALSSDELDGLLTATASVDPHTSIELRASPTTTYQTVVTLMGRAHRLGLVNVSIVTN